MNREWRLGDRGSRERHHEALLFFGFSSLGVLLFMAPLSVSSYVLQPRVPEVSLTVENIADIHLAYILGNLLQMAFRFWAFRRWVFHVRSQPRPRPAIEATLTDGGLAEALEDAHLATNVTLLRAASMSAAG